MSICLPEAASPDVSIIVLAWRSLRILDCLESIARVGARVPFEVVVVVNGATAEVAASLDRRVSGARMVHSPVNLGFASGCNRGARHARGRHLVFLNDDTEVQPGWLDALVATAESGADIGAVSARVLFPDGTLQEAGSVLFRDASSQMVGRGDRDSDGTYLYRRDIDYGSACSLLVKRPVWTEVGGFDERFFPGYYEDVDLCLAVSKAGQRVVYEPTARVVHHEQSTLHLDFKSFVFQRMRAVFAAKWSDELHQYVDATSEPAGATRRAAERARGYHPKVLVIDDRFPSPGLGSGFSRMFTAVRDLTASGWAVSCAASDASCGDATALLPLGVEVVTDVQTHLRDAAVRYDAVVISRPNNADAFAQMVREAQPAAALIYDAEALYHRRVQRQLDLEVDPARRADLEVQMEYWRAIEQGMAARVDHIVCVSDEEAATFKDQSGGAPVTVIRPDPGPVRWGSNRFDERRHALFVAGWLGGADSPNADGLAWFARDVLPRIRASMPWFRLDVTGGSPPPEVRQLEGAAIRFVGQVTDLDGAYRRSRVAIVPLRFGAGVKIKTMEAIASGVPTVATSCGVEGVPKDWLGGVLVADDPPAFAAGVVTLLSDRGVWEQRHLAGPPPGEGPRGSESSPAGGEWDHLLRGVSRERLMAVL